MTTTKRKTLHELADLIGTAEIGELAGTSSAVASVWRARHASFPEPLVTLRSGPVYSRREIAEWLRKTGRLPA